MAAARKGTQRNGNGTPPGQRIQRSARKLNRRKVQELAEQGMSTTDISQHQKVAPSTVWRFLQQLKPNQHQLDQFKEHRADCLAQIHGKALNVQELVLDQMTNDLQDVGFTNALTPTAKTKFLHAVVLAGGVAYDKERLERGKTTQHIGILTKSILDSDKQPTQPIDKAVHTESVLASDRNESDRR